MKKMRVIRNRAGAIKLTAILVVIILGISTVGFGLQLTSYNTAASVVNQVPPIPTATNNVSAPSTTGLVPDVPNDLLSRNSAFFDGSSPQIYMSGNSNLRAIYNGLASVVATPSNTTTLLTSSAILIGDYVIDTATVSGSGAVPTGTVDFQVSYNGGAWTTFDPAETLIGGTVDSILYYPSAVGNYNFRAIYNGDVNYSGSQSGDADEPLIVGTGPSFTLTWLGASTITLGQSVTDNVTVINLADLPTPTGLVDFQVSFNGGAYVIYDADVSLVDGMATSISYVPLAVGNYEFQAVYKGDAIFDGSTSIEGSEPLIVEQAASSTATVLSSDLISLGDAVFDTATVAGLADCSRPRPER